MVEFTIEVYPLLTGGAGAVRVRVDTSLQNRRDFQRSDKSLILFIYRNSGVLAITCADQCIALSALARSPQKVAFEILGVMSISGSGRDGDQCGAAMMN